MLLIRNFENEKKIILKEIMERPLFQDEKLLQLATPDRIYTHDLSESVLTYILLKSENFIHNLYISSSLI